MKRILFSLIICFCAMIVLAGCGSGGGKENNRGTNSEEKKETGLFEPKSDPNLTGTVTIWSLTPHYYEAVVPSFNKHYPNVKVEVVPQGFDIHDKTITAIMAGKGGPDIVSVIHGYMYQYASLDGGIENLYDPPYNAGQYQPYYPKGDWDRWDTIDGKKLMMPLTNATRITFYRRDIMEDYGYPSDPEEFGEYIQDKENWFNMAETFKNDDKYIITQVVELFYWYMENNSYDRELNLKINNPDNIEALNIAKNIAHRGLSPELWIGFMQEADQAVISGKLAAIPFDGMGFGAMEPVFESTRGKWGAAPLPFGANNTGTGTGSAILSQSKNKEAAWAFLEYMHTTLEAQKILADEFGLLLTFKPLWDVPEYFEHEDEFFAGQQLRKIALPIIDKAEPLYSLPLDGHANEIMLDMFYRTISENLDPAVALKQAEADISAANSQILADMLEKYKK